ncbi:winged helix-turn-helix domain-containing protein [Thermoproteota archaeon]
MVRRSKLEIMIDVLNIIQNGETKPTRIMYRANLSWKLLNGVLDSLISQGLVESINIRELGRRRDKRTNIKYSITSKGRSVLRYFSTANKLIVTDEKFNPFQIT